MKLFVPILLIVPTLIHAQAQSQTPVPKSYAELIGIMTETCPISTEAAYVRYRAKEISATEVVAALKECPDKSRAKAELSYAANVASAIQISADCLSALKELRIDALAHWENYNGVLSEMPSRHLSRVRGESLKIKQQATRARLACE